MCTQACVCMCACLCGHVDLYVPVDVHVCACRYVHMDACTCACIHAHVCRCVYACTWIICVHVCALTWICVHVHVHVCMCMCVCRCMCAHGSYVCMHLRGCVCVHVHVCVCMSMCDDCLTSKDNSPRSEAVSHLPPQVTSAGGRPVALNRKIGSGRQRVTASPGG